MTLTGTCDYLPEEGSRFSMVLETAEYCKILRTSEVISATYSEDGSYVLVDFVTANSCYNAITQRAAINLPVAS